MFMFDVLDWENQPEIIGCYHKPTGVQMNLPLFNMEICSKCTWQQITHGH